MKKSPTPKKKNQKRLTLRRSSKQSQTQKEKKNSKRNQPKTRIESTFASASGSWATRGVREMSTSIPCLAKSFTSVLTRRL